MKHLTHRRLSKKCCEVSFGGVEKVRGWGKGNNGVRMTGVPKSDLLLKGSPDFLWTLLISLLLVPQFYLAGNRLLNVFIQDWRPTLIFYFTGWPQSWRQVPVNVPVRTEETIQSLRSLRWLVTHNRPASSNVGPIVFGSGRVTHFDVQLSHPLVVQLSPRSSLGKILPFLRKAFHWFKNKIYHHN